MSNRLLGAALIGSALLSLATVSTPAHAALTPSMSVGYTKILNSTGRMLVGFKVCGNGSARDTGHWQLSAVGNRSDGSVISAALGTAGLTANLCINVYTSGTPSGSFHAALSFTGVVPVAAAWCCLTAPDVAGAADRTVSWYGSDPAQVLSVGV